MGYDSCSAWQTARDAVNETLDMHRNSLTTTLLDFKLTQAGRRLWLAVEKKDTGERFVALYIIRGKRGDIARKAMSEHEGPVDTDCPLSLLTLTKNKLVPSEYSTAWRKNVQAHHERTGRTWQVGDRCRIGDKEYVVAGRQKRSYIVTDKNGTRWRGSPATMVPVNA